MILGVNETFRLRSSIFFLFEMKWKIQINFDTTQTSVLNSRARSNIRLYTPTFSAIVFSTFNIFNHAWQTIIRSDLDSIVKNFNETYRRSQFIRNPFVHSFLQLLDSILFVPPTQHVQPFLFAFVLYMEIFSHLFPLDSFIMNETISEKRQFKSSIHKW